VGLSADGHATQVPSWKPSSDLDLALEGYAARLGELRKQMDTEMERRLGDLAAASEPRG
jgi:hypothetical protein